MEKIKVMLSAGSPGNMAGLIAEAVDAAEDMHLLPEILSENEDGVGNRIILRGGNYSISRIGPSISTWRDFLLQRTPDVLVDFSYPELTYQVAVLCCDIGISFVSGTTGISRSFMEEKVSQSNIRAVIDPNMCPEIVAFLSMLKYAAENFPGIFREYTLVAEESHQEQKKGTSGTAVKAVDFFRKMGASLAGGDIIKHRDPAYQEVVLGVPREHLGGHGWHTYSLLSEDGNVFFQFRHNVNSRVPYLKGVLDAVRFLIRKRQEKGVIFSMEDVKRRQE